MAGKNRKKKRKGARALFIVEIIVLLVLVGGIFLFAKITDSFKNFYHYEPEKREETALPEQEEERFVEINPGVLEDEKLSGYRNIAFVGLDTRDGNLEYALSDTMLIASINNDTQSVRLLSIYRDTYLDVGDGRFTKANAAYSSNSAEGLMSMMNRNLDLSISDYVVVDFNAVAEMVDDLGGISITMTAEEVGHMNNYCVETSEVIGRDYEPIQPEVDGTYQLNGVQAVAYARIRYTAGNDFKRAQRQRLVIGKIIEKAKVKGISALPKIADDVFPLIKTNLSKQEIVKMGSQIFGYELEKTGGFPFVFTLDNVDGGDVIIPVTLRDNVQDLHAWLFDEMGYEPSSRVQSISDEITARTGYGEDYRDQALAISANANPEIGSEVDRE